MSTTIENILLELGLIVILGLLYYFYQKRKIIRYEENKTPLIIGFVLQSCLTEKDDLPQAELDAVIESLDDYLHNRISQPPIALLQHYVSSGKCSPELSDIIYEALKELSDGKE